VAGPAKPHGPISRWLRVEIGPLAVLEFPFNYRNPLNIKKLSKFQKSIETCTKIIKLQNNFFLEFLLAALPRKIVHIIIFLIFLYIEIYEPIHC
jgi:hypothetical protein